MKMTKLVTTAMVAVSTLVLGGAIASAATYSTGGIVKFVTDTDITTPVDPLDPGEEVTPVDPTDPEKPIKPGTPGPLSIDFASPLYFGEQKVSPKDQVYPANAQPIVGGETRPNYVQVTDKRGGELGWSLQVKQNAQFETAEKNILTGAAISFENGTAVTDSESLIPSIVTKTFSLVPGADQVVMTAAEGEGAGTQLYRAGDDSTKANSVKLAVPGKTTKYKGTYETNLTWTLSDVPTNEVDPDPEA
ncbi:WxL domain-containing protein [Carnobacterium maltaromaticum]|uniref:WxL domain-containing protein n=1 Tax=Carnobacterium maltaromaticum TaxID=2751 RepID=UPI0039B02DA7